MQESKTEQGMPLAGPSFRVWLCGALRVERLVNGSYEPIRTAEWGGSSYPRLLLKALLCCPGRQARREALMELLWPDAELEQAAQYLNTATTKLRSVLRPAKGRASLLMTENDSTLYRLEGQPLLWVDTDEALALLKEAERLDHSAPEALRFLEEAAAYFSKGTFLQEEEGLWASSRRATVERARYQGRILLAETYIRHGMPAQAGTVLSLLLEEDPTDQDVLCRLMELLHRQGMTHQALKLYQQTCKAIEQDGSDITEATQRLAAQLSIRDKRVQDVDPSTLFFSQAVGQNNEVSPLPQALLNVIIGSVREWGSTLLPPTSTRIEKDDMDQKRRELLYLLSNGVVALALPLPELDWDRIKGALARPSCLDESVLHDLEIINHSLWNLYLATQMKSSVLDSALGHFKTLVQFLKDPHPAGYHRRLWALTSEISQLVGEIFFDLNDHHAAQSCYSFGAMSAKEAGSYDLWACSLIRHAFLPLYHDQYKDALLLIQGASELSQRGDPSLPTQYWAAAVEAEARSGILDLVACQRALDQAQRVQDRKEKKLPWVRFGGARLPALRGACYVRLQQPTLAMPVLQEALHHFTKPDRKQGMVLIDLAATAMQGGDVEQACSYVEKVMAILTLGPSGFLREALRTLPQRLESMASPASINALGQYIEQQLPVSRTRG